MKPDVSFSLLENGLDFILSAIENLSGTPSKRELKYAVLHLYSGAVLILKERLLRENWTLLFAKLEDADESIFRTGKFQGPDLKQCIKRLDTNGIEVSDDHKQHLRLLSGKRKRLEHFHFTDSAEAIIALTADVLNFLIEFISKELDGASLDATHTKLLDLIRSKLADFGAFVTARWESISSEIETSVTTVTCPACLQNAWVIEDITECKFCGYKVDNSQSAADEYIERVIGKSRFETEKDGGVWPRRKCPSCDRDSLVVIGHAEQDPQCICFQCGSTWEAGELSECSRCGEPKKERDISICDACFREIVSKDKS